MAAEIVAHKARVRIGRDFWAAMPANTPALKPHSRERGTQKCSNEAAFAAKHMPMVMATRSAQLRIIWRFFIGRRSDPIAERPGGLLG